MSRPRECLLFVLVGRVGDMVMATPALRATLRKHPGAEIHVLTSPDGRRVLKDFDPRVTEIIVYRRHGLAQRLRRAQVRRTIEARSYDRVYCMDWRPTYHRLVAGIGRRAVLMPHDFGQGLPFPEKMLRLVAEGAQPDAAWVSLGVREDARARAREILQRDGIDDKQLVVGLHPSFSGLRKTILRRRGYEHRKAWPSEAWGELARRLAAWGQVSGRPLVIMTDLMPEDRALGESLVQSSGGTVKLFIEPPDFERYKATLERMDLLVTPDTGPMHVAAAVGTRLVALFQNDPTLCGPFTAPERFTILRAEETDGRGLAAISPEAAFEASLGQLNSETLPGRT